MALNLTELGLGHVKIPLPEWERSVVEHFRSLGRYDRADVENAQFHIRNGRGFRNFPHLEKFLSKFSDRELCDLMALAEKINDRSFASMLAGQLAINIMTKARIHPYAK